MLCRPMIEAREWVDEHTLLCPGRNIFPPFVLSKARKLLSLYICLARRHEFDLPLNFFSRILISFLIPFNLSTKISSSFRIFVSFRFRYSPTKCVSPSSHQNHLAGLKKFSSPASRPKSTSTMSSLARPLLRRLPSTRPYIARTYVTRAHPKPVTQLPILDAIDAVLEGIEERKVKRVERWNKYGEKIAASKGLKVCVGL